MHIQPFGNIDPKNLEESYDGELTVAGEAVEIDVNFESESTEESVLTRIRDFVNGIDAKAKEALQAISDDFDLGDESETARFYLEHHLSELSSEEKDALLGGSEVDKQKFLDCLVLKRIGVYPEDEESYAVFDIQFPEEYTNYLMAVTFDEDGKISCISMDS
jgi:hypothetical protein